MVDIFSLDFNEFLIWWDCSDTTSHKSIKLGLMKWEGVIKEMLIQVTCYRE